MLSSLHRVDKETKGKVFPTESIQQTEAIGRVFLTQNDTIVYCNLSFARHIANLVVSWIITCRNIIVQLVDTIDDISVYCRCRLADKQIARCQVVFPTVSVLVSTKQRKNFVGIGRYVESCTPLKVFLYKVARGQGQFHTPVPYLSDIGTDR